MSLWNEFTDVLKGVAKGGLVGGVTTVAGKVIEATAPVVGQVAKPVIGALGKVGSGIAQEFATAGGTMGGGPGGIITQAGAQIAFPKITSGSGLTAAASKSMIDINTNSLQPKIKQYDPLLQAGVVAEEKVFSPLIKRPIATAALLSDPTSPLYDAGQYETGFQLSDVQAAYNRSEKVSLGVALTKSLYNPLLHVTGLSDSVKAKGLDLDKVNLWDDQDIQKNFVDNTLGRYMSGLTDALVGNVAIQAGVTGAVSVLKLGAKLAGFENTLNLADAATLTKQEKLIDDHITGTTKSVLGSDIERLATSKDINEILDILEPHSNNPRLANLIVQTEDPQIVRDFMLADKGYGPAIERLVNAKRSDDLWILGDAGKEMQADFITNGIYRSMTVEQRQRIANAFDDSIAKNLKHQEIYDAFLRDEPITGPITAEMAAKGIEPGQIDSVPRLFGKNYKPSEPIIGKSIYTTARTRASEFRVGTVTRDYSNVGGMSQHIIGRVAAPTALIKFITTKMPRGIVTNSGIRPLDAIEEFNAHFDDIQVFQNGKNLIKLSPIESISASDYRKQFIAKYLEAQSDSERGLIADKLNKKLVQDVARTQGITRMSDVDAFVDDAMNNINRYHTDLGRDSYAMDPSGVRIKVDPETQRQIRNSTPLLPVGEIEKQIINAKKGVIGKTKDITSSTVNFTFELGNRAFSFTQLVRPSYIGKNSIIEPLLVSTLSLGSKVIVDNFVSYPKNIINNATNKTIKVLNATKNIASPQKRALVNDFKNLSDEYNQAVQMLDNHVAEWIQYFVDAKGVSPATKLSNGEIVKRELRAAERLVRDIEEKLNAAAPEFSATFTEIPSLYNLTRRTQYLKFLNKPQYASAIANAKAQLGTVAGDINTLAPNLNKINTVIAKQYKTLENSIKGFAELHLDKEAKFSISNNKIVNTKKSDVFTATMANGQKIENIPNFGNKQNLGTAYQSEIANTHTRQIEFTGDKIFGQKVNMFNRKGPQNITDITSPLYFDELAYVVNNYMRGDILIDRILAGQSRTDLLTWGATRQGRSYAYEFGKNHSDIVSIIDNQIAYVNRYLPSAEAQVLASTGEVVAKDLTLALKGAMEEGRIVPIHPLDVNYSIKSGGMQNFTDTIDRLTTAAWVKLATPENKIRYAWASTQYKTIATEKLQTLHSQGYEITSSVINGVRQAAAAEVVKELEKTFYSIRRQNRALFMARTILAFPTASASGIYRYSRLAIKNPGRFSTLINNYYGLYNTFGVDKNGNPVDNPLDADFFVVPGTKEMGINSGKGLMFNTRATNFAVNFAGPSYLVPLLLGQIYKLHQGNDKIVKKVINDTIGHLPGYSYEELFPFGVETNPVIQEGKNITPGWWASARKYFFGDDGTIDFTNSLLSQYKYQTILYELGLGPKPTEKSILNAAKRNYGLKAAWQFGSLIGSPAYVETKPASIFQDLFNTKADAFIAQGLSRSDAAQAAEDYLNLTLRLPKGSISGDVLKQKMASKVIYIPRSQEVVSRIWETHSDLAKELELVDVKLVGLMTADLPLGTDPQVGKFLDDPNRKLPGGDVLNNTIKTPVQLENELEKSRFWKAYSNLKNEYNDAAIKAGYSSYLSVPELVDGLREYAKTLGKANQSWGIEYQDGASGNAAVKYSNGMKIVLNNKKYMDDYGSSSFWQSAKALMSYRDDYAKLYKDVPSGSKGIVQKAWIKYLQDTIKDWDPALARLIDTYFINDTLKETIVQTVRENK